MKYLFFKTIVFIYGNDSDYMMEQMPLQKKVMGKSMKIVNISRVILYGCILIGFFFFPYTFSKNNLRNKDSRP